ncbi:CHASE2 domain-containing protein [Chryseolinea sp. T2]|uniref:CHASE2 domain-containing protein n=1 Tax=Chryseolinea sp. T2 TaxID=3129255 RepID=UPI0030770589
MRKFWLDCVFATAFVFLALIGLLKLTQLQVFNAFDSIGEALSDVELTDYVFSGLRDDPDVDQNIVLVNIGNLSRRDIAQQISIISKYKPRVIGIDGFFDCRTGLYDTVSCPQMKDELGNMMLGEAIRSAGNVVLVTKLLSSDTASENEFDSLRRSDPAFRDGAAAEGFANLETGAAFQDDVKTCRSFNPVMIVSDSSHRAFSVELANVYDSAKTNQFIRRNNYSEVINYRGNVFDIHGTTNYPQMFYTLDVNDVFTENFVSEMIKDKIVIMGFMGGELGDPSWADKFYTPLNKKLAGKANPDMFGAVIHANIVSMILKGDYVEQMPQWQEVVMAILICLLNVALFSIINTHLPLYYDGITKLLQLIQLLAYSALMVLIFHWYTFKLDITITLAAVAVVGDVYEVYMSVIKNLYLKILAKFSLTPKPADVLTPETPEKQ